MAIRKIGNVGVDSGTVMIVDPCYVLARRENPETMPSYDELLDMWTKLNDWSAAIEPFGKEMGVVTPTLYGDGSYAVYAEYRGESETRPSRVIIEFENDDESMDDEDDEDIWSSEEDEEEYE